MVYPPYYLLFLLISIVPGNCFRLATPATRYAAQSKQKEQRSKSHFLWMGRRSFGPARIDETAKIDFTNFWRRSIANFTICEKPLDKPDFESYGGSLYWDMGDYVCRYSDHWTGQHGVYYIKECLWRLDHGFEQPIPNICVAARCNYSDFQMIKKKTMKKRNKWKKRKR
mmetsp:Transcript_6341/g.9336  ORF Transcript_6341/g.9336 Transcript_6341/m.9336 type:complete len:169 (+) Transcript_6341:30-536(+)